MGFRLLERVGAVCLGMSAATWAQVAPIPSPDGLSGAPFAVKHTWVIGGAGPWDYLTMDPGANQLLIAHGPAVQVVDVSTGSVAGTVSGFREAHAIALDGSGDLAYVTDGPANLVRVIDRRGFTIVGNIPTGPNPGALALEPSSGLLFVICSGAGADLPDERERFPPQRLPRPTHQPGSSGTKGSASISIVTVIDAQKRVPLADLWITGRLGFAVPDGAGSVYVTVEDANQIARLDGQSVANAVQVVPKSGRDGKANGKSAANSPTLDWTGQKDGAQMHRIQVGEGCQDPRGIAVDAHDARLFVACRNQKMAVLNAQSGDGIASFTIGPGADSIAWDETRGLIFTASGGGYGSVSVIRRDLTDTYQQVQNLPTLHQARTMAVNPSTGDLYVVTTLYGADVSHAPVNGIGTLKINPVDGSFQVLVIGN